VKKNWLFEMAFALGLCTLPGVTFAQYNASPYGNGSLAPSGYAVNAQSAPFAYAQPNPMPQVGQPYSQYPQQTMVQQTSPPAQLVGYPQETIAAPSVNSNQAPEQGWVGPNNGQYQSQPQNQSQPQYQSQYPCPPQQQYQPNFQSQTQPAPMPSIPMQSMSGPYPQSYNIDPGFANTIAPTAMNPGYAGGCSTGNCGQYDTGQMFQSQGRSGFGDRLHGMTAVPGKAWFVGGGALFFRRVDDHNVALTYDTAMPNENSLSTQDARQNNLNGFEVFVGRYLNCGRNALMLNYWGLYPEDETATIIQSTGGNYRSRHQFDGLDMPTQSVYDWYDGAISHQIVRSSQYQNVETNLLGFAVGGASRTWNSAGLGGCNSGACGDCGSCGGGCAAFTGPCCLTPNMCGSRLNWTWLAGFRWFRFTDKLQYAASEVDTFYNGGADDLYFNNNVRNDLVGFQLGSAGTYCLGKRFNVYALSKAGLYNNNSQLYTRVGRNGFAPTTATVTSGNIYNGQDYMVDASQNNAAFLGELGTGLGVRVTRGWSANVGYRVIAASGVATAVNSIPFEMNHLGNVSEYNNTSSLILHGLNVGGMYNF
jgi:Putative beta barrel porin-7 (BBP7)